jgi:hypothetical protein
VVGIRKSDHQMRPEEGKDGASRAPCAAFVSQPAAAALEVLASSREDTMRTDFELLGGGTAGAAMTYPNDFLGRPLRIGDVVVYAVLIRRLGGGQPLRRGVILELEEPYAWIRMLGDTGRAATVRIHRERVLKMPAALPARQTARLRAHVPRFGERRAARRPTISHAWVTVPITPEQTLAMAGIDDARLAEYQRKMSALLAGHN